jgi:two-component sensor histidine kinase
VTLDDLARVFWGVDQGEHTIDMLFDRIDEVDRADAQAAWMDSAHSDGPYDFAFRVTVDSRTRWISARGEGVSSNLDDDTVIAIFIDITNQKAAEEAQRYLVREMVHRIGNLFGIASSITALAARSSKSVTELADDLQLRFTELKAGFTYAVKGAEDTLQPIPLASVLRELVRPHILDDARITIDVPPSLMLESDSITGMAMIVHELATNAVKYGALGPDGGHVRIALRPDGNGYAFTWSESGGRIIDTLPDHAGFGTRLLDHTVRSSFDGRIVRSLHDGGLQVAIDMKASAFMDDDT